MALALALNVPPHELMFDRDPSDDPTSDIALTATVGSAGVPEWSLRAGVVPGGDLAEGDELAREMETAERLRSVLRALDEAQSLMSSVEKRTRDGRVMWLVRWRDPDGRQRKRTFAKRSEADRFVPPSALI